MPASKNDRSIEDLNGTLSGLRQLHAPVRESEHAPATCKHDHAWWPCMTAELIYPDNELYEIDEAEGNDD